MESILRTVDLGKMFGTALASSMISRSPEWAADLVYRSMCWTSLLSTICRVTSISIRCWIVTSPPGSPPSAPIPAMVIVALMPRVHLYTIPTSCFLLRDPLISNCGLEIATLFQCASKEIVHIPLADIVKFDHHTPIDPLLLKDFGARPDVQALARRANCAQKNPEMRVEGEQPPMLSRQGALAQNAMQHLLQYHPSKFMARFGCCPRPAGHVLQTASSSDPHPADPHMRREHGSPAKGRQRWRGGGFLSTISTLSLDFLSTITTLR